MDREDAPTPIIGEHPADYIDRVVTYLTEPDRRRMGEETAAHVRHALTWMRTTPVHPLDLSPEVKAERRRVLAERQREARLQAERALIQLHSEDYDRLRAEAKARILEDYGPLPGDEV